jgi:hypothetical protein
VAVREAMHGASADGPSLGQGRHTGRPAWKAGSAPDATRNSATAFPRSSAVPAGASAWNEDGRWTRAAGGETPHRAERCSGTGRGCGGRVGRLGRGAARRRPGPLPLPGRTRPSWGDVARDDEHVDYLQLHPDEFTALFNIILINVTNFVPRQRRPGAAAHPAAPRAAAPPRPDRADSARSHPGSGLAAADAAGLRLRPTRDPALETASVTSSVSERATPG